MTIPVNKVVQVNILTSPTFPARKGFGLLLIAGISTKLPVGERIRFYSDMDGVAGDFSSTDEEYKAAQVFFSQAPRPAELAIGRRFASAAPGELLGSVSTYESSVAAWQAVTAGGFRITIDGTQRTVGSLNFSSDANLNAVASRVQTALVSAGAVGATVTFSGSRFIVRSGTTGAASTVDYAIAPVSGTDISAMLGLDAAGLGLISAGVDIETIADSLDALQNFDGSWYGVSLTNEATEQNLKDAAAWVETRTKILGYTTKASNVQDAGATSDIATFFKDSMYRRTFGVWDNNDDYAHVSAMGRAFTVNFNEQNSTLTLKFKTLPGITPTNISESQRQALLSKNINYYTYFGTSAMLAEGVMANGAFFDEVHGLDWLQNAIETNVFGFLYTRKTKVPQTDKGVQQIVLQVEKAMKEGVNNGLLAPGTWNGEPLGEIDTGDFLVKGYYIFAQPVSEQNQSDREARKAPPIQVLAKGAGAIHFASITVNFER
jgi:hypothetical protein